MEASICAVWALMPASGSESMPRSEGWMYAGMPRAPQTGTTDHTWSM